MITTVATESETGSRTLRPAHYDDHLLPELLEFAGTAESPP